MKILKKILVGLGVLAVVLVLASVALLKYTGAWGAFFPSRDHETVAPQVPGDLASPAVLLFTKTNSFRHVEAIDQGVPLWEEFAQDAGFGVYRSENGAIFNDADLANFDVVIFHNATGDMLDGAQEDAFIRFLEDGGGWIGVHAAGDGSHKDWRWYVETLIGSDYTAHTMGPQFQEARLVVEDADHPATRNLPVEWNHVEEWYAWEDSPRDAGVRVLVSVDESTYQPWVKFLGIEEDLRMGDHPIVWSRCVGKGRAFYSALGHQGAAYEEKEMRDMLRGALAWTAGLEGEGCEDVS